MLKKLFKQEWIATTKVMLPVNLLLIAITLLGSLVLKFFPVDSRDTLIQSLSTSALMLYLIALIGIACAAYIFFIVRFYKTMYSDEGYLTHTLPVTVHTLIIGKGLATVIWLFITYTMLMASIRLLIIFQISPTEWILTYQDLLTEIAEFNQTSPIPLSSIVWMIVLTLIIKAVYSFLNVSASLSIGQLFTKHKIIGSILVFCGIYVLIMMTFTAYFAYMSSIDLSANGATADNIYLLFASSMGLSLFLCAVFYLVTWLLTSRKLNLD